MAAAHHPTDPARDGATRDELAFWDEWLQEMHLGLESLAGRAPTLHSHGPAHPRRVRLADLRAHLRAIQAAADAAEDHLAQGERAEAPPSDHGPPTDHQR